MINNVDDNISTNVPYSKIIEHGDDSNNTADFDINSNRHDNYKEVNPHVLENTKEKSMSFPPSKRTNFGNTHLISRESSSHSQKQTCLNADKKSGYLSGRWTSEEHTVFLICLRQYGREWKKIANKIPTRTPAQIRSHAQKYLSKRSKADGQVLIIAPIEVIECQNNFAKRNKISATALEKIEEIKNDPSLVEDEVKSTLESLHEMYKNLQLLLESRTRQTTPSNRIHSPINYEASENTKTTKIHKTLNMVFHGQEPSTVPQTFQHRELRGQEIIAIQVLGTCLNTTFCIGKSSSNTKKSNVTNTDAQLQRKRKFNEFFDRL